MSAKHLKVTLRSALAANVLVLLARQLCLVRFTPSEVGKHEHSLVCVLNNDPGATQKADLFGQGALPALKAVCGGTSGGHAAFVPTERTALTVRNGGTETGATLYLKPTCVGVISAGTVHVRHLCALKVSCLDK